MIAQIRNLVHREPIIMWSFFIGGVGEWTVCNPSWLPSSRCSLPVLLAPILKPLLTQHAGLALPLVVPPIRESLGYGKPTPMNPPPVRQLIENAKK